MAKPPSREQEALQHVLATGSNDVVAAFLAANPGKMRPFTGLNKTNYQRMVDYLQSGDSAAAERARSFLDDALDRITQIPTSGLKLTDGVKAPVVRAQRNDEFFALVKSVSSFLRQPLRGIVKIPTELVALTAASLGFDKHQRLRILTGITAPIIAATAFNTMVAVTQPADAALPVEPSAHSETVRPASRVVPSASDALRGAVQSTQETREIPEIGIHRYNSVAEALADLEPEERTAALSYVAPDSPRRSEPLEITITPRRSVPLEVTITGPNRILPSFETAIASPPVATNRLTPELVRHMQRSERARDLVALIRAESTARGLDADLAANQLYKETSFLEKYITGRVLSSAGAVGFGQIMPATAARYGFTVAQLKNPETAVKAWGTIMSHLTQKYGGDQRLASIAYNGGEGAIEFVRKKLDLPTVTFDQWVDFMVQRRAEKGTMIPSAWHVETLEYAMIISPNHRGLLAQIKEREAQGATAVLSSARRAPAPEPTPAPRT